MKRLKSIWMTFIIVILSITMAIGTTSLVFAAAPVAGDPISTAAKFYTNFEYGVEYTVGSGATVIAPNGESTTPTTGRFTPTQLGAYTIKYTDYSYNVSCTMEKDYEIRVENQGADIATYLKKGAALTIPKANVWYKNDKGDYVIDATQEVFASLDAENGVTAKTARTVEESKLSLGAHTIHYYANIKGANGAVGKKYISQDFTVKIQSDFADTTKPELTVVNVPSEISIGTKVTLPTATITDDYDANVKVVISVKQYDEKTKNYVDVKVATVDDNGFGKADANGAPVVFDNKNNLSFYPTAPAKTKYKIEYTAVDDAGNKANPHNYDVVCIDKSAPILKDIDASKIPTKWGLGSITNGTAIAPAKTITFPYPEYVDNSDSKITVSFEIKDTVNNNTVIRFNNIYDYTNTTAGDGAKYTYSATATSNGLYRPANNETVTFTKTGFAFDFNNYTQYLEDGKTKTGTYTVTYRASDTKPNNTTKSFDISLEDAFVDKAAPDVKVTFADEYLVVTDTKTGFIIPKALVSDNQDTNPTIEYKLISGTNSIIVDGGETAKLVLEGTTPYLIIEKNGAIAEKKLQLDTTAGLKYSIKATDDAKNEGKQETTAGKEIKILTSTNFSDFASVVTTNFTGINVTDRTFKAGDKIEVGSFTIKPAAGKRDFVGFEMSITNGENEILSTPISFENAFITDTYNITNIEFTPSQADTYTLYIRVFDVTGKSIVKSYSYTVENSTLPDDGGISSTNVPVNGNIYTTYQLKNKNVPTPVDIVSTKKYIIRKVTAPGKFSMMGTQFTAYSAGTYSFTDGYMRKTSDSDTNGEFAELTNKLGNEAVDSSYKFTAEDKSTTAWHLQGKMPTYSEKNATVALPFIIATSGYKNSDLTLTVTDAAKNPLTIAERKTNEADQTEANTNKDVIIATSGANKGQYTFATKQDGSYTVVFSVKGSPDNSKTYTIKCGDVVAPSFTVVKPDDKATENGAFKFSKVTLNKETDAVKDIRFVKRLKAPDGTVEYEVDSKGDKAMDAETPLSSKDAYTFKKTGTYTVEYVVYDKANNDNIQTYTVNVSAAKVNNPVSTKIISTVLIIVGVLLIAGAILYFVRFRKIKTK